jgi:hypothetical protein
MGVVKERQISMFEITVGFTDYGLLFLDSHVFMGQGNLVLKIKGGWHGLLLP